MPLSGNDKAMMAFRDEIRSAVDTVVTEHQQNWATDIHVSAHKTQAWPLVSRLAAGASTAPSSHQPTAFPVLSLQRPELPLPHRPPPLGLPDPPASELPA